MLNCTVSFTGIWMPKNNGNCLPAQMNKSYLCLSVEGQGHLLEFRLCKRYIKKEMQLGSLIKKNKETSCLLTQCLAQGIQLKPFPITFLVKVYSTSQSAGMYLIIPEWSLFSSSVLSLSQPPCMVMLSCLSSLRLDKYFL